MQSVYINVASITYAIKTEKILNKNNIKCRIIRTPIAYSKCGCSYSVIIDKADLKIVLNILDKNSIRINSIIEI